MSCCKLPENQHLRVCAGRAWQAGGGPGRGTSEPVDDVQQALVALVAGRGGDRFDRAAGVAGQDAVRDLDARLAERAHEARVELPPADVLQVRRAELEHVLPRARAGVLAWPWLRARGRRARPCALRTLPHLLAPVSHGCAAWSRRQAVTPSQGGSNSTAAANTDRFAASGPFIPAQHAPRKPRQAAQADM